MGPSLPFHRVAFIIEAQTDAEWVLAAADVSQETLVDRIGRELKLDECMRFWWLCILQSALRPSTVRLGAGSQRVIFVKRNLFFVFRPQIELICTGGHNGLSCCQTSRLLFSSPPVSKLRHSSSASISLSLSPSLPFSLIQVRTTPRLKLLG